MPLLHLAKIMASPSLSELLGSSFILHQKENNAIVQGSESGVYSLGKSDETFAEMTENSEEKLRREHEEFKRRHEESCALINELRAENDRLKAELLNKQNTQEQQVPELCNPTQSNSISNVTLRKLTSEFTKVNKNPPPGISVKLVDDSLLEWEVLMYGPHNSPFAGGAFRLRLGFPNDYPSSPPKVWFFSEMFHPNVFAEDGRVCIDIIQSAEKWKPQFGVETILVAVQILLEEPNPLSPANPDAGDLFQTDPDEYYRHVRSIVQKSESFRKSSVEERKMNFNTIKRPSQLPCVVM